MRRVFTYSLLQTHRFFHLNLVYFDSTEFVFELAVEREHIAVINFTALKRKEKHDLNIPQDGAELSLFSRNIEGTIT